MQYRRVPVKPIPGARLHDWRKRRRSGEPSSTATLTPVRIGEPRQSIRGVGVRACLQSQHNSNIRTTCWRPIGRLPRAVRNLRNAPGLQSEFEAALWRLIIAIGTRAPRVTDSALPLVAVLPSQGPLYFAWGC